MVCSRAQSSFSEVYILGLFPCNRMSFTHEEEIKVAKHLLILSTLAFECLILKHIVPEPNYQKCKQLQVLLTLRGAVDTHQLCKIKVLVTASHYLMLDKWKQNPKQI